MAVTLPDPRETARAQADLLRQYPVMLLEGAVARVKADSPFVDGDSLIEGLEAFYRERMAKIPSPTKYPESPAWVEYALAVDRELQALAGLTDLQMAIYRSLGAYLMFRGYACARPAQIERCRVVYLPETDRGEFHIKNVDDPKTFWKPAVSIDTSVYTKKTLNMDGVGSGLHMDDEPEEIFPLPALTMVRTYCDDVPGAVEFLTRYSSFWGGGNLLLWDEQKRSVAIEKCSYNYVDVFYPGANGGSHISGLACRDAQSPQGQYQAKQRLAYLEKFHQPLDGPDMTYWQACDRAEAMLGAFMQRATLSVDEVLTLFLTNWPDGLQKPGVKLHPDQAVAEYTLATHAELYDEGIMYYWQRDAFGNAECAPRVYSI